MNFKTTIVLLILLVAVGGYLLFTHDRAAAPDGAVPAGGAKLLDLTSDQVTKLTIEPAGGAKFVLEKQPADVAATASGVGPAKSQWKITEPATGTYADAFKVNSAIDALTAATSSAQVKISGDAATYGLDQPPITVTLEGDGKSAALKVGNKQSVGNGVYVQVPGRDTAEVADADLLDKLDLNPASLRQTKLIDVNSSLVRHVTLERPGQPTIALDKPADKWAVTAPTTMPAQATAVSNLVLALNDLTAAGFGDAGGSTAILSPPRAVVTLSTAVPTTAPTTAPSAAPQTLTLTVGQPDSVLEKNVWVKLSPGDVVARVPKESLNALDKKPLDFRDLDVLTIAPADVRSVTITKTNPATTQPTTQPERRVVTVIDKAPPPAMGPARPASIASTTAATTSPTTLAATMPTTAPASTWRVAIDGRPPTDADDAKVGDLLAKLNPLRAEKFLDALPTTRPSAVYSIDVATAGAVAGIVHLDVVDPGDPAPPVAAYNGLNFEVTRSVLDAINASLAKTAK